MSCIAVLSLLALLAMASLAQAQQTTLQKLIDVERKCGIFVAAQTARAYPHISWSGACGEGLAEGDGVVRFATGKDRMPEMLWHGNFRNGFFTGAIRALQIKPLADDRALVRLPGSGVGGRDGTTFWLIARLPEGPLPLCGEGAGQIAVEMSPHRELRDATILRTAMQRAAMAYRAACPQPLALRFAVVPAQGLGLLQAAAFDQAPGIIARAGLAEGEAVEMLHDFQLLALDTAITDRRSQQRDAAWRQWREFSRASWVVYWVTAAQLHASPARYEGKVVAMAGKFLRLVAPDAALVLDERGGQAVVRGLPNALLKPGTPMVIAGYSLQRRVVPFAPNPVVTIDATAWRACQRNACGDYLDWMESQPTPFPWGEDQSRY